MEDAADRDISRNEYLFQHLIAMFQALAFQQLGKLVSPITGGVERDLQQARITIDMLEMIKEKTAGNLSDHEKVLLEGVLMELQLNFVDELRREEQAGGGDMQAAEEPQARSGAKSEKGEMDGGGEQRTDEAGGKPGATRSRKRSSSGTRRKKGARGKAERDRTNTEER